MVRHSPQDPLIREMRIAAALLIFLISRLFRSGKGFLVLFVREEPKVIEKSHALAGGIGSKFRVRKKNSSSYGEKGGI